jgi:hypothetical protein
LNSQYDILDNNVLRQGKPLNEMATNRQRAMIMNNFNYLHYLKQQQALQQEKTHRRQTHQEEQPENDNKEGGTSNLF